MHTRRRSGESKAATLPLIAIWRLSDLFIRFVRELEKEMGIPISADELLLSCQAHWFKTYIDWLNKGKRFRIEGEGSMESYWKRISQLYHDKKNKALPADVFTDVEAVRNCYPLPSKIF